MARVLGPGADAEDMTQKVFARVFSKVSWLRDPDALGSFVFQEPVGEKTQTVNNGKTDVPSVLIEPVAVDEDNLASTVIADGLHKVEDVCK
ncbi:hypothetical protein WME94_06895 [Sorangium sp. So ce429]